jgi:tRNA(Ile)-lysidine synthase
VGAEQQTRFLASLRQLTASETGDPIPRLALAISGGPDSLALLLLAHACLPGKISAATVDHGLRPEAAHEAEYVAELCAERAIPHQILRPDHPITGNIQSEARKARYTLLQDWAAQENCATIVTAHHADDQLETILMRLARGSGIDGLSGVRAKNGNIIRPLLGFTKAELTGICAQAGVAAIADPSNENTDFDRVRMRQWLAASDHPLDAKAASISASALAEASAAIDWMITILAEKRIKRDGDAVTLDASELPTELARRLLIRALALIEPDYAARGQAIGRLLQSLQAAQTATIGNTLCSGGSLWRFQPAPKRGAR